MKTIFDQSTRDELTGRIQALDENAAPLWGKMTVYQMLKHCTLWEEMIAGNKKYKQVFLGRLFGKMAMKSFLDPDKPIPHSAPTIKDLIITGNGDIAAQKKEWIARIGDQAHFSNDNFIHPFFGKMTKEQIGVMAYKHSDHHLRQFGA